MSNRDPYSDLISHSKLYRWSAPYRPALGSGPCPLFRLRKEFEAYHWI